MTRAPLALLLGASALDVIYAGPRGRTEASFILEGSSSVDYTLPSPRPAAAAGSTSGSTGRLASS